MPKSVDGYFCVNNCGDLVLQGDDDVDGFHSYCLSEVTYTEKAGIVVDGRRVFTVSVYMCPVCGYIELYDKE